MSRRHSVTAYCDLEGFKTESATPKEVMFSYKSSWAELLYWATLLRYNIGQTPASAAADDLRGQRQVQQTETRSWLKSLAGNK